MVPCILFWIPMNNAPVVFFLLLGSPAILSAFFGLSWLGESIWKRERPVWQYIAISPLATLAALVFVYTIWLLHEAWT